MNQKGSTVTVVLVLILLITLAVGGYYLKGFKGGENKTPTYNNTYVPQASVDDRPACGDFPTELDVKIKKEHFDVIKGPTWSPDCKYIAWSFWQSGTSYQGNDPEVLEEIEQNPIKVSEKEGVFVYKISGKSITNVYKPKELNKTPELVKWESASVLIYKSNNKDFRFDIEKNINLTP